MIIDKYLIDVDTLDILPKGQDKIIYFRWCKCPDCILFENEILKKYENINIPNFYVIEVDEYRMYKDDEEKSYIWTDFTKRFGIDKYQGGRIPCIVKYRFNRFMDMMVYLNDVFDDNKIVGSYYNDCPFIGRSVLSRESYYDLATSFHNKKADEFFSKHILNGF